MALIKPWQGTEPRIADDAFIAENATVIGDVEIGEGASVWYSAVLRGDVGHIKVGARTNIQDGAVVHMTGGVSHAEIGRDVTVGHAAIIHGAKVGDGALIGMGSIILDNAEVGAEAIVGAGALVPPGMKVPPRSLVLGSPAKVVRELSDEQAAEGRNGARIYADLAAKSRG